MRRSLRHLALPLGFVLALGAATAPAVSASTGVLYVSSDTTLTEDHYGSIVIKADNLILDGAGHTLHMSIPDFSCHGVTLSGHTGVTIKNLRVVGFTCGAGFLLGYSAPTTGNLLLGNVAEMNHSGFVLNRASSTIVEGNRSDDNFGNGFQIETGSHNNTFTRNTADGNNWHGFAWGESNGNVFIGNKATNNAFQGFGFGRSAGSVLRDNHAEGNGWPGFVIADGSSASELTGNTATGNGGGFLIRASDDNFIHQNTASATGVGFILEAARNNTFTANLSSSNSTGFLVREGSSANVFSSNTLDQNEGLGFAVDPGSSGNRFEENTVARNGAHGFSLSGTDDTTLIANIATENGMSGFFIGASTNTTVEGNTAQRNGRDTGWNGFNVDGGSANVLRANRSIGNGGQGFRVTGADRNTLTGNTANLNGAEGFLLSAADANQLLHNTANRNGDLDGLVYAGFALLDGSSGNELTSNTANRNGDEGFVLEASSENVLLRNRGNANGRIGFEARMGSSLNTFRLNVAQSNPVVDALDDLTGGGNQWLENKFGTTEGL